MADNSKDSYQSAAQYYIELEQKRFKAFKSLVERHAELIAHMWGFGDGNGGYVHNYMRDKLIEKGLFSPPQYQAPSYVKKKIDPKIREDVFVRDGYKCVSCGSQRALTVDHIYPESLGGGLELSNLQTLCKSCNSKKGKKVVGGEL